MTFTTVDFLIFYVVTLLLYYIIPLKYKWMLLLACGYFFYYKGGSVIFLLFITIPDYFLAKYVSKNRTKGGLVFFASIALNVIILVFFKFALANGGFNIDIPVINSFTGNLIGTALPLGLSFIILRKIGYISDVRQGLVEPEKNFGKYALFLSYFPSVSSGPIDRYNNFNQQIKKSPTVDYGEIVGGFRMILFGLFKKIFIAERLVIFVNEAYSAFPRTRGLTALMAVYFFSFYIYADFSGYTDIAIGISRTFGLSLPKNFDRPYFSRSITEFWTRWHITLSSWLRDYLFMPLAGIFVSKKYFYLTEKYREYSAYISAIVITWFLAGAWHGNELSMLAWGLLQAVYLAFSRITKKKRKRISKAASAYIPEKVQNFIRIIFTFHLVSFTWIFFRAGSLKNVLALFKSLLGYYSNTGGSLFLVISGFDVIFSFFGIFLLIIFDYFRLNEDEHFFNKPGWLRWTFYYVMIFLIIFVGVYRSSGFLYVKF